MKVFNKLAATFFFSLVLFVFNTTTINSADNMCNVSGSCTTQAEWEAGWFAAREPSNTGAIATQDEFTNADKAGETPEIIREAGEADSVNRSQIAANAGDAVAVNAPVSANEDAYRQSLGLEIRADNPGFARKAGASSGSHYAGGFIVSCDEERIPQQCFCGGGTSPTCFSTTGQCSVTSNGIEIGLCGIPNVAKSVGVVTRYTCEGVFTLPGVEGCQSQPEPGIDTFPDSFCGIIQIDFPDRGFITRVDNSGCTQAVSLPPAISQEPPTLQPPSETPPPSSPTAQCIEVKAYDTDWNLLTAADMSALSVGDTIRFTVLGSASTGLFDNARFTINGVRRSEVSGVRPGSDEFFDEYIIPPGVTNFDVTAEVHHQGLGTWF